MPRSAQGAREGDVLREEAVARVHGLRPDLDRGGDDRLDREVGLRGRGRADAHGDVRLAHVRRIRVGVAVDRDGADAESAERADDAARDLAAIRDEHGVEEGAAVAHGNSHVTHIRKTPKRDSGSGVRLTTSRASPRRSRVSAGSMTPSSQSRAVA